MKDRAEPERKLKVEPANEAAINWLFSCPPKGFFVPVDSESTGAL